MYSNAFTQKRSQLYMYKNSVSNIFVFRYLISVHFAHMMGFILSTFNVKSALPLGALNFKNHYEKYIVIF